MTEESSIMRARLNKHAAEIATLEERHRKEVKRWRDRFWMVTSLAIALIVAVFSSASKQHNPTWRSDAAPKLERLTVVTEGFVGKDGRWRSFDTGEEITVHQWRP